MRYFAHILKSNLKAEIKKDRLGTFLTSKLKESKIFISGRITFEYLLRDGLQKHDVLFDYGCGDLRVGVHAIKYLGRGAYWGLDVDDARLTTGRTLIGPKLIAEKAPNIRIISKSSIKEVLSVSPTFVCSFKVMSNISPTEIDKYINNIALTAQIAGKAIIQSKWSDGQAFKFGECHWAHSLPAIREMVSAHSLRLSILEQREWHSGQQTAKAGLFRIEA